MTPPGCHTPISYGAWGQCWDTEMGAGTRGWLLGPSQGFAVIRELCAVPRCPLLSPLSLTPCPALTRTSSPRRRRRWPESREHRTGSARSEGYYPISRREKARYLRPCPAPRPDPDAPDTQVRGWAVPGDPAVPAVPTTVSPRLSSGSQPGAVGAALGTAAAAERHRLGRAAGQRPAQAQPAQGGAARRVQGGSASPPGVTLLSLPCAVAVSLAPGWCHLCAHARCPHPWILSSFLPLGAQCSGST